MDDESKWRAQAVNLLQQIEVAVANGKTTAQTCREAEIVEQTYFRWHKAIFLAELRVREGLGWRVGDHPEESVVGLAWR